MPEITTKPLSFFVDPIVRGEPYSFARYGDGEWASVLGKRKHPKKNCDGHFFFPEMQNDFQGIFRGLQTEPASYNYFLGMQGLAMRLWGEKIDGFLKEHQLYEREWHNANVFHHASQKGELGPLITALKKRPVIVVGPAHLSTLDKVFGYNEFVQVPHQNCYLQLKAILNRTRKAINNAPKPVVVAISASMPAEIIIHRLYRSYGKHAFLIDFGSVFDPYTGVLSRKYHQGMKLDDIRAISPGTEPRVATGSAAKHRTREVRRASRR